MKATKVCSCCKIEKPLSEFGKNVRDKDGYDYYCKDCKSKIQRENRLKRLAKETDAPAISPNANVASHAPIEHAEKPQQDKLLKDCTPRELILELKNRGYKGRLVWQPPMPQPIVINLEEFN